MDAYYDETVDGRPCSYAWRWWGQDAIDFLELLKQNNMEIVETKKEGI